MAKVAFIAHCLLNQNAKVIGGAKRPGMWEPLIDLLRERDWVIRQMPCPELAFGGVRRFWWVRDQADTPVFRAHCRRLARSVAAVMEPHVAASDDVVLIGVDSSPTLGVDYQPSSPTWGGEPNIGDDDTVLVAGEGIFLEELRAELDARGLPMPRRTGIRHWFPDYDETEERARLLALLEGPAGTAAATATNAQTVAGPQTGADPRSGRIAVVADSLFLEHLDRLEGEGVGIMQLPPATASETTAVEWIRQTAEQVVAYLRVDYEVSLIDDGAWGQTLDMALAELGERPLSRA
jgi:predicted secreted protein